MHPIGPFEDYVAIKPRNIPYILRDGFDCNIEEPLFLPKPAAARDLYQNIGIVVSELKVAIERELHSYERDCEIGPEYSIVC